MADKKLSELAAGTPAQLTDKFPILRGATNLTLTIGDISALSLPIGGGTLTGNLYLGNNKIGIGQSVPVAALDIFALGNQIKLGGTGITVPGFLGVGTGSKLYLTDYASASKGLIIDLTTGNVGIGTTTSATTLHIKGVTTCENGNFDGTYGSQIIFSAVGVPTAFRHKIATTHSSTLNLNKLTFSLSNTGGSVFLDVLTIVANGAVGIGTISPTSALQVVGLPIYASNATAIAGGLTVGAFYRTNGNPDPVCVVH